MTEVSFQVIGARVIAAEFLGASREIPKIAERMTRVHGQRLVTKIKANASGRPGPNAPTGDYRRSWTLQVTSRGGFTIAIAGTNRPQGRRLEYGFHGVDSLGRHYNQPAYPHVGPAIDAVEPGFLADMEKVATLG